MACAASPIRAIEPFTSRGKATETLRIGHYPSPDPVAQVVESPLRSHRCSDPREQTIGADQQVTVPVLTVGQLHIQPVVVLLAVHQRSAAAESAGSGCCHRISIIAARRISRLGGRSGSWAASATSIDVPCRLRTWNRCTGAPAAAFAARAQGPLQQGHPMSLTLQQQGLEPSSAACNPMGSFPEHRCDSPQRSVFSPGGHTRDADQSPCADRFTDPVQMTRTWRNV